MIIIVKQEERPGRNQKDMSRKSSRNSVKNLVITLAVLLACVLAGNNATVRNIIDTYAGNSNTAITNTVSSNTNTASNATASSDSSTASGTYQWTEWDASKYPDCYRIVGPAVVDRDVEAGSIQYDGFDSLGRTQRAVGNITESMVQESAGWRADFKSDVDTISGWKGNNHSISVTLPNGKTYKGYCYNRSHLVGDCLGGYEHVYNSDGSINQDKSKSEKQNLVTGTRMQNVGQDGKGGMAYCENLVCDYLNAHPDVSVYYSATPVYNGNDFLCRSVFVDIKSNDGGLDEEVEVFNAESGCTIDYATGKLTVNK